MPRSPRTILNKMDFSRPPEKHAAHVLARMQRPRLYRAEPRSVGCCCRCSPLRPWPPNRRRARRRGVRRTSRATVVVAPEGPATARLTAIVSGSVI